MLKNVKSVHCEKAVIKKVQKVKPIPLPLNQTEHIEQASLSRNRRI